VEAKKWKRVHEVGDGVHHAARDEAHVVHLHFPLMALHVEFSSHLVNLLEK
jgi:hypothetical protein